MPKLKPETLADRKRHILSAALTCFSRNGYNQSSMDDIVREAGLSKGGVYVHFDSKRALFLALIEWVLDETGIARSLQASGGTPYEQLLQAIANMTTAVSAPAFQDWAPLLLDMWLQHVHDKEIQQLIARQYDEFRQPLEDLITACVTDGSVRAVNAASLASILMAVFDGLMVQALVDASAVDWTAVGKTLTMLVSGLSSSPQTS